MRSNALTLIVALCFCGKACGDLSYGDAVRSPDGRLRAIYLGSQIRIEDNGGGAMGARIGVFTVRALNWTGDSKTIVIVEHLAGGSQLALIHFDDGQWKRFEIEPPLNPYDEGTVVDLMIRRHSVRVTYKVRRRDAQTFLFYVSSFDVDAATRARSNEKTKEITLAKYRGLRQLQDQASIRVSY